MWEFEDTREKRITKVTEWVSHVHTSPVVVSYSDNVHISVTTKELKWPNWPTNIPKTKQVYSVLRMNHLVSRSLKGTWDLPLQFSQPSKQTEACAPSQQLVLSKTKFQTLGLPGSFVSELVCEWTSDRVSGRWTLPLPQAGDGYWQHMAALQCLSANTSSLSAGCFQLWTHSVSHEALKYVGYEQCSSAVPFTAIIRGLSWENCLCVWWERLFVERVAPGGYLKSTVTNDTETFQLWSYWSNWSL